VRRFPAREAAEWAGWAGREAEAQWGEGEQPVGKKVAAAGPKDWMGRLAAGLIEPKVKEFFFLNKNLTFEYTKAL
jgi:hypothetical protein